MLILEPSLWNWLARLGSCGHLWAGPSMSKYLDPKKRAIVPKGKSGFSSQKRKGIITDHAYTAGLPQKAMKSEGLALSQLVTSPLLGLSVHLYKMGKWQVDPTLFLFLTLCLCLSLCFSFSLCRSLPLSWSLLKTLLTNPSGPHAVCRSPFQMVGWIWVNSLVC